MPLTGLEKSKIKKHMGYPRSTEILDAKFEQIDDEASWLSEVSAQVTLCDTRLTNYETAKNSADNIKAGFGAVIDERVPIREKYHLYIQAVDELARLVEFPVLCYIGTNGDPPVSGYLGGG
jgi:hypothetical protein